MRRIKTIDSFPDSHHLICLVGRPGSGIETLLKRFMENFSKSGKVKEFSTEARRAENRKSENYYISEEELAQYQKNGEVVWSTESRGYHSGVLVNHLAQSLWECQYSLMVIPIDAIPLVYERVELLRHQRYFYVQTERLVLRARIKQRNGGRYQCAKDIIDPSKDWDDKARRFEDGGWPVTILRSLSSRELYQELLEKIRVLA